MKLIYYPPAFILSQIYALSYAKKVNGLTKQKMIPEINTGQLKSFIKVIKKNMLSPRRNKFLGLTKEFFASYYIQFGDTVLDVGAHIGRFSQRYSSLVGKEGTVFSFEAHPDIFDKLKAKFIGRKNIKVFHSAVSSESNLLIDMKIYPGEVDIESSTVEKELMDENRMPGNTKIIKVKTIKLDDLLLDENFDKCSFIKIDVEGHEHAVIDGAKELIKKFSPVILFEYGYEPGKFQTKTIEQMESMDYIVYDCKNLKRVRPQYISIEPTDLVGIPRDKIKEFENLSLFFQTIGNF